MLKRSSMIMALLLAFATLPLFAQNGVHMSTDVPFPFIVQGKTLPAGQYDFYQNSANNEGDWMIRSEKSGAAKAIFETENEHAEQPKEDTSLYFVQVGDTYYLSDLWTAGGIYGWHVPVKLERSDMNAKPTMRKVEAKLESEASS